MRLLLLISTVALGTEGIEGQALTGANPPVLHAKPFPFKDRMKWAAVTAISPRRFAGYTFSSAIATGTNEPPEYGPHWEGFGKRIGLRMSTGATGLFLEAAVGSLWDEDPRYHRSHGLSVGGRLWHVAKMSVMATNEEGEVVPAYARYMTVPANSFLTNAWRPDSHATADRAARRISLAFVDRIIGNAFVEFWPAMMKPFHKESPSDPLGERAGIAR
jgi:hypothetical protein